MDGSTGVNEGIPDDGAIVLFDGLCNLCSWSVRFVGEPTASGERARTVG